MSNNTHNETIIFHNPGAIDHRAFTMLGLSAKSNDNAIGFFGTGFKYAISTLLRMGASILVLSGDKDEYRFSTFKGHFREKEYDFIKCTHVHGGTIASEIELPFTTHLGANWTAWQAYRELYTNALDEKGDVIHVRDVEDIPTEGIRIHVYNCDEFAKVYEQHEKYFIDEVKTISQYYRMRCVEKVAHSDNVVYYRGMYTGTKVNKPTYFTYDYKVKVDLTEDRTLKDTWFLKEHITCVWTRGMKYDQLVEYLPLISSEQYFESELDIQHYEVSDDFKKACAYLTKMKRRMPMWARETHLKTMPFEETVQHFKPTKYQKKQLDDALKLLAFHGHDIDKKKLLVVASLPENLLGYVRDSTIYIARKAFDEGYMRLVGTLLEEHLHLSHGHSDCTREMQNKLIDMCAELMLQVQAIENS